MQTCFEFSALRVSALWGKKKFNKNMNDERVVACTITSKGKISIFFKFPSLQRPLHRCSIQKNILILILAYEANSVRLL